MSVTESEAKSSGTIGSDRRAERRKPLIAGGKIIVGGTAEVHNCTILDKSGGGARIGCHHALPVLESFFLLDMTDRAAHEVMIASKLGREYGLRFLVSYKLGDLPDHLRHIKRVWFDHAR